MNFRDTNTCVRFIFGLGSSSRFLLIGFPEGTPLRLERSAADPWLQRRFFAQPVKLRAIVPETPIPWCSLQVSPWGPVLESPAITITGHRACS